MQNTSFLLCIGLILVIGCKLTKVNAQSCSRDSDCTSYPNKCQLRYGICEYEAPTQKVTTYAQKAEYCEGTGVTYTYARDAKNACTADEECTGVVYRCDKKGYTKGGYQNCKTPSSKAYFGHCTWKKVTKNIWVLLNKLKDFKTAFPSTNYHYSSANYFNWSTSIMKEDIYNKKGNLFQR